MDAARSFREPRAGYLGSLWADVEGSNVDGIDPVTDFRAWFGRRSGRIRSSYSVRFSPLSRWDFGIPHRSHGRVSPDPLAVASGVRSSVAHGLPDGLSLDWDCGPDGARDGGHIYARIRKSACRLKQYCFPVAWSS